MSARRGYHRYIRIKVIHHKDDAVAATVVVNGQDYARVRVPPLRGMHQAEAADAIAKAFTQLNACIQGAMAWDASKGPTKELSDADD